MKVKPNIVLKWTFLAGIFRIDCHLNCYSYISAYARKITASKFLLNSNKSLISLENVLRAVIKPKWIYFDFNVVLMPFLKPFES